jgi:RsmE family RNA methyltransferase
MQGSYHRCCVNLLLLEPGEVGPDGVCRVGDRRARHLREVLGAGVGASVRAGVVGGAVGTAEVLADDGAELTLRVALAGAVPVPLDVELVLAVPRPKVVTRTIEIAASFAVSRIELTNAWRVDKSYLRSPRLDPRALELAARFGAEQGATTHVPPITVHERLMGLLDERWPAGGGGALAMRLVAHPGAPPIEDVVTVRGPTVLAIGPEGGWIERELETLVARGFRPVSLGAPILRVEAAVASALGQLLLLHRIRQASPSS